MKSNIFIRIFLFFRLVLKPLVTHSLGLQEDSKKWEQPLMCKDRISLSPFLLEGGRHGASENGMSVYLFYQLRL